MKVGGTGSLSHNPEVPKRGPERFESGTVNAPGIWALGAGLDFVKQQGIDKIKQHKKKLTNQLSEELVELGVKVYLANNESGVLSFNICGLDSTEVAFILDDVYQIAVRAGLHCSPLAHDLYNTKELGTVRVSFSMFNTEKDVKALVGAVKEIKKGY